jgi:hypothetical protein
MQEIGQRNAKLNLFGARDANPDAAAKAQDLAKQTGLPPETVERNLGDVEQQVRAARQDKILKESPGLVQWLQDGSNARIAHDDFDKLGFFEKTWQSWAGGMQNAALSNERSRLGYASMAGSTVGDQRIADIDQQLRKPVAGDDDLIQRVVRSVSGLVGGFADQLTSTPVIAGTAVGTAAGAVGGLGVLDPVTVPVGASAGFISGLVADGFRMGAGQTWLSLKAMRDADGNPIDSNVAMGASVAAGLALGALNAVGVRGAGRPIAEGAQALVGQAIEDAVKVPTARAGLATFGAGLAKSAATGAAFGAANEGILIAAEQAARTLSSGDFPTVFDDPEQRRAAGERLMNSMMDMAMGFGAMGLFGHGAGFAGDLARSRQAMRDAQFLESINGAAADSATRKRAPDAFARFVEDQSNGQPVDTIYIPAAKVRELYQRVGLDPFEITDDQDPIMGFVPDRRQQLEQGLATNGDVAVPLAQYISRLAGSDFHNALKEDIRVRPDGMTLREANDFRAHYEAALAERGDEVRAGAQAQAEKAVPGMAVFDDALKQLRASGYTLDTARQYAALISARYVTRGARLGTDALSEYQRAGLSFQRVLPESLRQYQPDELDVMLQEMKSGKTAPSQRQLVGSTLLEYLASKGGLKDEGGELSGLDIDQWHREKPFRRKLIQDDGLSLDDAALMAHEAGYFPELVGRTDRPEVGQLIDAISGELTGNPRRPDFGENRDAAAVQREQAMADLDRLLNEAGIDLRKSSVKEARAALDRYQRGDGRGFGQPARPPRPATGEPVARLKGDELGPAGEVTAAQLKEMREAARTLWKDQIAGTTVANKDLGEIKFTNSGRAKFFSNTADPDKLRLLPALRQIVEKADLVDTVENPAGEQPGIRAVHWLEADVAIGDQSRRVGFSVREDRNGQLFYNLNATPELRQQESAPATPSFKSGGSALPGKEPEGSSRNQKVGSEPDGVNLTIQQPGEGTIRGSVRFEDGRAVISLFEKSDLSTVIHEMGHVWLEELVADAARPEAPQQLRDDLAAVLKWFGVKDPAEIASEHHEQWARAFEAYALEGKAPSAELGGVFQRFKAWLVSIYKAVATLRTPINDEVRGVFDRLIATDDELAAARDQIGERQLFGSAEQAGMTEAEFKAYLGAVEKARDRAETSLLKKVMADVRRKRQATWQAEEARVREDVTREVDRRADIAALQYLRRGRIADHVDGVDVPDLKLSRQALIDMYGGPGVLDLMPRGVPPFVVERGGVHPDVVAEMLGGFRNGRDMVDALLSLEDQQRQLRARGDKKSIRNWMIDDETNRRMVDRHGDMLNDGSIQEEALAVLHSDDALAVHAVEMRALARRAGREREATPLELAKKWAADQIADKRVKDATVLGSYRRTERAAAHAVEEALLRGDQAEAFRQKQAQMLAAALYSEAKKAADEVESGQRMLNRYATADTLKAMDQDYLEQIHGLLERFDFRQATGREVRSRRSFAEWATDQQANGVDVVAPASLISDAFRVHYTEMTMAEFRGLVDSVKQIAHLGRLKKELIVNAEKREFEAVVQETVERLADLPQRNPSDDINPGRGKTLPAITTATGRWARKLNAALLKMETVFEWLDGGSVDGPFHRVVWQPIAEAQHARNDLLKEYTTKLIELRNGLDAKTQARMLEKVATPELLNKETLRPFTMRLEEVVAIALNWGNAGNRDKLLKGYGWSEDAVKAVLDRHMTPDLWKFVQGSWDVIETLWPRIAELERRVNGVAPEKVERVEVDTPHGKFAGGYYPVVYDPLKSFDAAERAARNTDNLFENIYTRATTPKGFTKQREESYARPVFLSLDVIPRHVAEVIHDITHREAVMQADKFLSNRDVLKAVEGTMGREYTEQFRPWLQSIANEYAQDRRELAAWDQISKWTRMRATMVGLGFRLTTMMSQPIGLFDSSEAIGAKWVAAGLAEAYGSPARWKAARDFAFSRSGEMRNRMNETERDVRDAMRELLGKTGWVADSKRFAYYGIAMLDMAVALPTWLGAYKKALSEGAVEADAVHLADRAVRDSQGAGGAKDLAAVQRGTEWMKLATMFYSYFSHFYQRQATLVRDARNIESVRDVPHLLARSFFLMVAPTLLSAIVTGQGPKEDEDWGAWAARKVGLGLFNGIPLLRDVGNSIDNDLGQGYARGYQFTPVARIVDTVWKTAKDAGNATTGGEASDRWVQHALETSGYLFGLPLGQGGQTGQFLYNVMTGDEQPDGVAEWLKGLTFGRTHDK